MQILILFIKILYLSSFCVNSFNSNINDCIKRQNLLFNLKSSNQNSYDSNSNSEKPKRVTNSINVPIRQQIEWAKAYKRFVDASQKTQSYKQSQKFRKEKGVKDVIQLNETELVSYVDTKPPAIFIDGYNIIGFMKTIEGSPVIDFEESRDNLISDLAVLRSSTGWWIEVVFDAYKKSNYVPKNLMRSDNINTVNNVIVTYTSKSETADNYIERRFNELSRNGFTNMLVATDDYLLRQLAGSMGMGYLSASMLSEELRIAYYNWEQLQADMYKDSVVKRSEVKSIQIGSNNNDRDELMKAINKLKKEENQKSQSIINSNNTSNKADYGVSAIKLTQKKQNNNNNNNNNNTSTTINSNQTNKMKKEKSKKYSDDNNVSFGGLRKPIMADGLSDELKKIMDKLQ